MTRIPRNVALAVIQAFAALAIAPTGLVLEATAYTALWSAWAVSGVIAWLTRRQRHSPYALAVGHLVIWAVGVFFLPRLSGGIP